MNQESTNILANAVAQSNVVLKPTAQKPKRVNSAKSIQPKRLAQQLAQPIEPKRLKATKKRAAASKEECESKEKQAKQHDENKDKAMDAPLQTCLNC